MTLELIKSMFLYISVTKDPYPLDRFLWPYSGNPLSLAGFGPHPFSDLAYLHFSCCQLFRPLSRSPGHKTRPLMGTTGGGQETTPRGDELVMFCKFLLQQKVCKTRV